MWKIFSSDKTVDSTVQTLPDHSRVWVYQSNREFTDTEVAEIQAQGQAFVGGWAAHGQKLAAAFEVVYNLFIVISVDEKMAQASGCSIDASVGLIRSIQQDYQIDLLDRMNITYRDANGVSMVKLPVFQQMLDKGELNAETIVFNNLVQNRKELVEQWEVPLAQSWHRQLLS